MLSETARSPIHGANFRVFEESEERAAA